VVQSRAAVSKARPPSRQLPTVTIQLPIYNERYVAGRVIDAVAAIDYPRERLSVQVLDDSTDVTTRIIASAVAQYSAGGLDISHVRRGNRDGYKAGALSRAR
jgi:cellulose synthase/poly-beta-1,6-N-acetylglucosamine synthase-like glycosyltransferase